MPEALTNQPKEQLMDLLKEEFKNVRTRQGRGGNEYNYVASPDVIARLNKVFGICWSVEEVSSEYLGEWVIKKVRITVRDEQGNEWIKEGYGGHKFMPNIDPSDTHKSAFSKALSKAASLLGVGLYLWGPEEDTEVDLNKSGGTEAGITQYPNQSFAPPHVVPQGGQNIPPQNVPRVQSTGYTQGPGTAAVARTGIAQVPSRQAPVQSPPSIAQSTLVQNQSNNMATQNTMQSSQVPSNFQIMSIKAVAMMQKKDPIMLVREILGPEAEHVNTLEQLTQDQASKVLASMRSATMGEMYTT